MEKSIRVLLKLTTIMEIILHWVLAVLLMLTLNFQAPSVLPQSPKLLGLQTHTSVSVLKIKFEIKCRVPVELQRYPLVWLD